ncbi:MAG: hypothetical protein R3250_04145 [Melioribacteraceae bacterium]|nr:hypothetical protein [Melioribacteraceae bacterium]
MKLNNIKIVFLLILTFTLLSCTEKFDISEATSSLDEGAVNIGDTIYVQQFPEWTGFNNPQDIIVGREPFIYVADTDNDRIVMLDISGNILGEKAIQKPTSIAQNYELDLLVVAEFDTVINDQNLTFSALYQLDLFSAGHIISNAQIRRVLPQDPKIDPFAFNRTDRYYTGICALSNEVILISRTGPSNSNPVDRDNSVLILNYITKDSIVVGRIPGLEPLGTGILSANNIGSLTAFENGTPDIIISLIGKNSFKVQWLEFIRTTDFEGYQSKLGAFSSDLMTVNRFEQPQGVTLDDANNIYVADAQKDSVFKFNTFGDEMESFGGEDIFSSPYAVAYHDRTLYVLDNGNNRIVRFILSTEID